MIKAVLAGLLFTICASSLKAQGFPATEKDVKEILCHGSRTIDSLGVIGINQKMKTAAEANMEGTLLTFKSDGTYSIAAPEKTKVGKWTIVLAEKQVNMYPDRKDHETIIREITRDHLLVVMADDSKLKIVFKPFK